MIFRLVRKTVAKIFRLLLLAVAASGEGLLFMMQRGKCMYCGIKMEIYDFHADLKVPLSRGGTTRISNKQLLCSACNRRKDNATDEEFRSRYPFLKPSGEAKSPPRIVIPQSRFNERDKELRGATKGRKPRQSG